jgi:hypothetical protein
MSSASLPLSPRLPLPARTRLRDVVLPKEHGSWSLALEPLALGLLVAPSRSGAALAVAALAAFFARRPLKIVTRDANPLRRRTAWRALACCGAIGATGFTAAVFGHGFDWLGWLVPSAVLGGVFVGFDLENGGREEFAELAGAGAFACVTAAIVAAAGEPALVALAALIAMAGRAVPTVMFVRACVRGAKTGTRRVAPTLVAAALALAAGTLVAGVHLAPWALPAALAVLFGRCVQPLVAAEPIRARTLGLQELALGAAYVAVVGAAWQS